MAAPATTPASIDTSEEAGTLILRPTGGWLLDAAADLDRRLHALDLPNDRHVVFDLSDVDRLDTAGAWLLLRTEHALTARGNDVALENVRPNFEPLLAQIRARGTSEPVPHPIPAHHTFTGFLARIGEITVRVLYRMYRIVGFGGLITITTGELLRNPRRLRLTSTLVQMEHAGLDAMPIVGLLSFLIGIVFAYQGADQLRRFGAEIYTVNLLGIAILRELGVVLTAILIAGRSGSAFTAQIGTMQVNQEIDALRTLGIDPTEILVLPRMIALVITLPMLVFYADAMGLLGGALMTWATLGISIPRFLDQLRGAITEWTLWVGIIKAPFFAVIIAMVGCFEGFNVSGSADSVGRLTTQSVVESIFLVILADAAFSILFSVLGI
ncbi:MAG TPA: MlaE family lipid ABC transporter permease subunit [Stellaceae bacterium]|jgi:phospholipid/cholesterol/gamma-HCH transport system permease protein|nr:MlaE family lipid ABC transporter permease subunit [Stellaceae bacterium]